MLSEMAWWYHRVEEDFLRMPLRQVFRRYKEMIRQQAVHESSMCHAVSVARFGDRQSHQALYQRTLGDDERLSEAEARKETRKAEEALNLFGVYAS